MADKAKVVLLGSVDPKGFPQIKAMLRPRKRNGIKEFWFSTNTSSMRVQQFEKNPRACIYFYDCKSFYHGVMLVGTIEVLHGKEATELTWKRGDKMYCEERVRNQDYCVLKFTATKGRQYSHLESNNFFIDLNEKYATAQNRDEWDII